MQGPVDPDQQINRDHDRDQNVLSKVRLFFFKQGLDKSTSSKVCLKKFQQGLPEKPEQVTTETDLLVFRFRQIHLTFHHQGLLEIFQSKSA